MVSLRLKNLLAEEVTLTLMEGMASMVSLRMKDLLVEKVTLTLMGNMASLVSLRVKDPLAEEVSLMRQKYHVGAMDSKVMGLVVVTTMEFGIPGPSERCCISTVGGRLLNCDLFLLWISQQSLGGEYCSCNEDLAATVAGTPLEPVVSAAELTGTWLLEATLSYPG